MRSRKTCFVYSLIIRLTIGVNTDGSDDLVFSICSVIFSVGVDEGIEDDGDGFGFKRAHLLDETVGAGGVDIVAGLALVRVI